MKTIQEFLTHWEQDPNGVKPVFMRLLSTLKKCEGTNISLHARPGISYSLRGTRLAGKNNLFVMVDVVDDSPAERWLSVCFYDAYVADPIERGEWVPKGLNGQDARCFDVSSPDTELVEYVEARILEAWQAIQEKGL